MKWCKLLLLASSAFAANTVPEYEGISKRPANGDVKWNLSGEEIIELSTEMADEEIMFIKTLLSIENPTVENVLIPTIDRDNHLAAKINELDFYQYVSSDAAVRSASAGVKLTLRRSALAFDDGVDFLKPYRAVMKRVQDGEEKLEPEYFKYLQELLKTPNRTILSDEDSKKLNLLKTDIGNLETEFNVNVNNLHGLILLLSEELKGVPQAAIESFTIQEDGKHLVPLNQGLAFQILQYAHNSTVRRTTFWAFNDQCPENEAVLTKLVRKRFEAARLMGYVNHAEYMIRDYMAKTPQAVIDFMYDVEDRIKPTAEKELANLLEMKNADLRRQDLPEEEEFYNWDFDYYHTAMLQNQHKVNQTKLAEYFPTKRVIKKLFEFFENLYDVKVVQVENTDSEDVWHPSVLKFAVYQKIRPEIDSKATVSRAVVKHDSGNKKNGKDVRVAKDEKEGMSEMLDERDFDDQTTYEILYESHGEVPANKNNNEDGSDSEDEGDDEGDLDNVGSEFMGWIALDVYTRENKFTHAAAFEIGGSSESLSGERVPAYVSVVANLPDELPNYPSLATPQLVSMLFHELGHGFHILLSRTKTMRFLGSHVPMDFVECPSQMLEQFMKSHETLKQISHHFLTGEKVPDNEIKDFTDSINVNGAMNALRQLYAANFDMEIHNMVNEAELDDLDIKSCWNSLEKDVSLVSNADYWNNGFAQFTHVTQGYDAGYYSYAWSLIYAHDIYGSLFEGKTDIQTPGIAMREKVLKHGGLKNPMEYLTDLLGRAPSSNEFLKKVSGLPNIVV